MLFEIFSPEDDLILIHAEDDRASLVKIEENLNFKLIWNQFL